MNRQGLLNVRELGSLLRVSLCTVYRMVENREIPFIKKKGLGIRFRRQAIDQWLEKSSKKDIPEIVSSAFPLTLPAGCDKRHRNDNQGGQSEMAAKAKSPARKNLVYGAIYPRKTKQGIIRWYLDYYDEAGERVQRVSGAASEEEAARELRKVAERVFNKRKGIKDYNFQGFSEVYLESYAKSNKRTWKKDEYSLNANLKPYFGTFDLRDITPLQIEEYRAKRLKDDMKKSSINRETALLRRMFHLAIEWGYCSSNPVSKIRFFSERDNLRERILTEEEETRLLSECADHLRPIVITALHTGMRLNEILGLLWKNVDLEAREIKVTKTKSGKDRVVPIDSILFEVLDRLKQKATGDYVFLKPETDLPLRSIRTSFEAACRRAEIKGLRFHDTRHTFASRLIKAGVDIISVQKLLGHYSVTMTQRYTHSGMEQLKEAVETLCKNGQPETKLLQSCDKTTRLLPVSALISVN